MRIVPGNPGDDDRQQPGKKVTELTDVDGDTVEVFDLGATYHLKITGPDGYRLADLPALTMHTLVLQILAHINKKNRN